MNVSCQEWPDPWSDPKKMSVLSSIPSSLIRSTIWPTCVVDLRDHGGVDLFAVRPVLAFEDADGRNLECTVG